MTKFMDLQVKDNDKKLIFSGKKNTLSPDYKIADLQCDLNKVGIYTSKIDGDFGQKTLFALKVFQWCCINIDACIKNGARLSRTLKPTMLLTGKLNKNTYNELKTWIKSKQIATGDLIRIDFSSFTNIEASSGFKKINAITVKENEIVVSKGALKLLIDINAQAKKNKITIMINQAFRVHGVKVTGAVVMPATKSQHLIGHAIDCNIVDGGNWNNSTAFKNNTATEGAKKIIKSLKASGYRWGGDFTKIDTPHIDKKIASKDFAYKAKFFLNQRMISQGHSIPKKTITAEATK